MPDKKTGATVRENSELLKFHAPYGKVENVGKNKVYVSDFADPSDLDANLKAAGLIAKGIGKDIYIRPHIYAKNYKNPEFAIGQQSMHGDLKNYRAVVKGKPVAVENFIGRQLAKANKQGCNYAVLNFADEKIPDFNAAIVRNLFGETNGINKNLQNFVVIRAGKVSKISRKEIENKEFESFLDKLR